jgi:PAS domain S-box-containing protein
MCDKLNKIEELTKELIDKITFVDKLQAAINTSHEGIAILDTEGKYIYLNNAHEEMFGYDPGEMVGKSWEILYKPEDIEFFKATVFPIIAEKGKWNGTYIGYSKQGDPVHEEVYLTSLKEGGLICTCRVIDITNKSK